MAKKKGIIGFKGLALAPIKTNTVTAYETETAIAIPYAGSMSKTPIESEQSFYYDDDLYAKNKNVSGMDVEIRVAEINPKTLAEDLGIGTYDEAKRAYESDFNVEGKEYALRCVCATLGGLPTYFCYRLFELSGVRFDNFTTKGESITLCEAILTGTLKRPALASALPQVQRDPMEDGSDIAQLDAWLAAAEKLPAIT